MANLFGVRTFSKKPSETTLKKANEEIKLIDSKCCLTGGGYPVATVQGGYKMWVEAPGCFSSGAYDRKKQEILKVLYRYFPRR